MVSAEPFYIAKSNTIRGVLGCAAFLTILRPLWRKWLGPIVGAAVGGRLQKYLVAHRINHAPEKIILYYADESETEGSECSPGPDSEAHLTTKDVEKAREFGRAALSALAEKKALFRFYCSPYWGAKEALSALLEGVELGLHASKAAKSKRKWKEGRLTAAGSVLGRIWRRVQLQTPQEAEPQEVPTSGCRAAGHFLTDHSPSRRTRLPQEAGDIQLISDPRLHLEFFNYWKKVYDIEEDLRLRDQELGFGRSRNQLLRDFLINNFQANLHHRFSGAESGASVYDRLLNFKAQLFEDFLSKPKVDCCVLVAHKVVVSLEDDGACCCGSERLGASAEVPQDTHVFSCIFQDRHFATEKCPHYYFEDGDAATQAATVAVANLPLREPLAPHEDSSRAAGGVQTQRQTSSADCSQPSTPAFQTTCLFSAPAEETLASASTPKKTTAPAGAASVCSSLPPLAMPLQEEQFIRQSSPTRTRMPARSLSSQQQRRPSSGNPRGIPDCKPPQQASTGEAPLQRAARCAGGPSAAKKTLSPTADMLTVKQQKADSAARDTLTLGADAQAIRQQQSDWVPGRTLFRSAAASPKCDSACSQLPRETFSVEASSPQGEDAGSVPRISSAGTCHGGVAVSRERSPRAGAACQNFSRAPRLSGAAEEARNTEQAGHSTAVCDASPHGREGSLRLSERSPLEAALERGRSPGFGGQSDYQQDCFSCAATNTSVPLLRRSMPPKQPIVPAVQRGDCSDNRSEKRSRSLSISGVSRTGRSLSGPRAVQTLSGTCRRNVADDTCSALTPRRSLQDAHKRSPSLDLNTQPSPGIFFSKVVDSAKKYEAMKSRSTSPSAPRGHGEHE